MQFPSCHHLTGNACEGDEAMQTLQDQRWLQARPMATASCSPPARLRCARGRQTQASQPTGKTQQSRSFHGNGITLAKPFPQELIPRSSTWSGFGQREGMQQTWLPCQKCFETVSNKFSLRDFTAENGGKRCRGVGTSVLQSPWKKSLQENWGRSREESGKRDRSSHLLPPSSAEADTARQRARSAADRPALLTELCCQWHSAGQRPPAQRPGCTCHRAGLCRS